MKKQSSQGTNGKKGFGKVIITIIAVIVVVIASLLGFGGESAEEQGYSEPVAVVSEEVYEGIEDSETVQEVTVAEITFRNDNLLEQHYEKHGMEMGFASPEEYELAAYKVIINPYALHKIESEDGDDVYYVEETNEFVVVSQDGYIRTYFNPSAGIDYYNRQ